MIKYCGKCGTELKATDKFCTSCGSPQTYNTEKKGSQNKNVLWIGIIGFLVLFLVFKLGMGSSYSDIQGEWMDDEYGEEGPGIMVIDSDGTMRLIQEDSYDEMNMSLTFQLNKKNKEGIFVVEQLDQIEIDIPKEEDFQAEDKIAYLMGNLAGLKRKQKGERVFYTLDVTSSPLASSFIQEFEELHFEIESLGKNSLELKVIDLDGYEETFFYSKR